MNEEQRKFFDEVTQRVLEAQIIRYSMTAESGTLRVFTERAIETAKYALKLRKQYFDNENLN